MKLHTDWIQGFIEGDGHFSSPLSINSPTTHKLVVSQDKISVSVLYALKKHFVCGSVHKAGGTMMEYSVGNRKHLIEIIIKFFDQRLFISEYKFKQYLCLRSSLLSFNDSINSNPLFQPEHLPSREWLAGFIDAEGCFYVSLFPSTDVRIGMRTIPKFFLGLGEKEEKTLKKIHKALDFGFVRQRKDKSWILEVSALKDLNQIMSLLDHSVGKRSLLKTHKRISYNHWREIILIMNQKGHLTEEGLKKICRRKLLMNCKNIELKIESTGNRDITMK